MVDSADRNSIIDASGVDISSPWNFAITKRQSLINGYFSRVGTTEVTLEWCIPNVSSELGNNTFEIRDASGIVVGVTVNTATQTVQECLDNLVAKLELVRAWGWVIDQIFGEYVLTNNDGEEFRILPGKLAKQLGLNYYDNIETPFQVGHPIICPDIRPYRYIDFVCNQLTAVQDVKDASTQPQNVDVLCRWYFADDSPNILDGYGFPVLQGYTKFVQRRIFNPPKQIKWEQNFPVGGYLQFQVLDPSGNILPEPEFDDAWTNFDNIPPRSNWLMTLQMSEG